MEGNLKASPSLSLLSKHLWVVVSSGFFLASACSRPPSHETLTEWTPADHDGEKSATKTIALAQVEAAHAAPSGSPTSDEELGEISWQMHCQGCHGDLGKGDGPHRLALNIPDLSRREWQKSQLDEQIAEVVAKGKNAMPAFKLPPKTIGALVLKVRSFQSSGQ